MKSPLSIYPVRLTFAVALLSLGSLAMFQQTGDSCGARASDGVKSLLTAISDNDLSSVRHLWNALLVDGRPPGDLDIALTFATGMGRQDIAFWLLAHGANPNGSSPTVGTTPLMAAAGSPNGAQIARRLLTAGANPDFTNNRGQTALDMALLMDDGALLYELVHNRPLAED